MKTVLVQYLQTEQYQVPDEIIAKGESAIEHYIYNKELEPIKQEWRDWEIVSIEGDVPMYSIRSHESGDVIDDFEDLEDAQEAIRGYILDDKKDGSYTPEFYEIYDNIAKEIVEIA